ncbi:MAG: lysophospholipid acyltransferase family protein [Acidobacteriaceae bacterium]|nr:lysophospholipid acyltransferase family protein [Acidobacteriaceae bacterium]
MVDSAPRLLTDLFVSVPKPVQRLLDRTLQLPDLRQLYNRACHNSQTPLSRALIELLQIDMRVQPSELERIPCSGPLVVVANHPFGILDGLMLDAVLWGVRRDVKILTNSLVADAAEISERCIPVDVFSPAASATNLKAVRQAKSWLRDGHAMVVFPAGEVSHWRADRGCVSDPPWSELAARLAIAAEAPVAPIYFVGCNSLAFQIAGFVHPRLRTVRLPRELFQKRGSIMELRIGVPVRPAKLCEQGSASAATEYLRARTYMLAHRGRDDSEQVCGSRSLQRTNARAARITAETRGVCEEIGLLEKRGCKILETSAYAVFAERGEALGAVLSEIGRLRELTFRIVGEGTGKAVDLDRFDPYYTQVVLWNKQESAIAGGYRLAWTDDVLPAHGVRGLYTSTLFRFAPPFFEKMGSSVELGRSFVCAEFQRDYAPLMLLWQAIGRLIGSRPHAPVLFGPISISAQYSEPAAALIVEFLKRRRLRADLAAFVSPRHPFRSRLTRANEIRSIVACLRELDDLSAPLAEIQRDTDVPVLLRHYVRLGGRVTAFNVDHNFSNVIDGLLVVDLRQTAPKLLSRYLGAETAAAFLRDACDPRSA